MSIRMEESSWHAPDVRHDESAWPSGRASDGRDFVESLLTQLLEEQRKTNQLLLMLVEALSQEADQDEEPRTYMDGSRVS